jgi:hypothetical protein
MFVSTNPKTTVSGILLIIMGLLSLFFGVGLETMVQALQALNPTPIVEVILPILTGTGLLSASDNKKEKQ